MKIENLKLKIERFMLKDLRFKMKSFRFIVVMLLLLPIMVCAQPDQPSPFKGTLAGERPMDLNQKEKQATFSGGASANGLMNTGSTYSPNPEIFIREGSENGIVQPPSGPRKTEGWPNIPFPDPIGDAALPLALCALAYLIVRVARRRTRAYDNE